MAYQLQETEWIWRDGEFIAWKDATVHVLAHSMQFGSSAFEGIRCYDTPRGPAIFRLEDHLQRLLNSCKIYRMDVPYGVDELVAATCELVEKNGLDACYIRPMVIRGYRRGRHGAVRQPGARSSSPAGRGARTSATARWRTASTPASRAGTAWRRTPLRPWPRSPATTSAVSSSRWKRSPTVTTRPSRSAATA